MMEKVKDGICDSCEKSKKKLIDFEDENGIPLAYQDGPYLVCKDCVYNDMEIGE